METKTHYRKAFKSDHLGVADLEDFIEEKRSLIFTIDHVKQYLLTNDKDSGVVVAGKRISANIAFFKENIKPLVLNATNSDTMKLITGKTFVEEWNNTKIELFILKKVQLKGRTVDGVRIKKVDEALPILTENHPKFNAIKEALKNGNTIEQVRTKYQVSNELEKLLKNDKTI